MWPGRWKEPSWEEDWDTYSYNIALYYPTPVLRVATIALCCPTPVEHCYYYERRLILIDVADRTNDTAGNTRSRVAVDLAVRKSTSSQDIFLLVDLQHSTEKNTENARGYGGILSEQLCAGLCDTMFSQQHTYMSSSYRSNRLSLSNWYPYAVRRSGCLELYYCNMVQWFWWDSSLISTTNWFPSVLWHCWFGHLACKNRPRNDL